MKKYSLYLTNAVLHSNKITSASYLYQEYEKTWRLQVSLRTNIWTQNFFGVVEDVPIKPNISVSHNTKVTTNNPVVKQVIT